MQAAPMASTYVVPPVEETPVFEENNIDSFVEDIEGIEDINNIEDIKDTGLKSFTIESSEFNIYRDGEILSDDYTVTKKYKIYKKIL